MNDRNKKIVTGIVVAVGVILVCALCYFASSAVSAKAGDNYSESDTNSNNSATSGSSASDMTSRAQQESAKVPDDEKKDFNDIDIDEYLDLYDGSKNSIVLFSRPTCGYCQIAEPILHHIAYQYKLTINHVNTDEMSSSDEKKLVESDDYFSDGFGTPLLVVVSNGEIVDMVSGLVDTENYVKFFTKHGFIDE